MSILSDKRIILGVTGSIAAYKAADLASKLTQAGAQVDVILTGAAENFITPLTFQSVTGRRAYTEKDLWGNAAHVLHVGLGHSADLLVIAPCTANTIGKAASGIDDTPVTSVLSVALGSKIPVIIAPAMHEAMYGNEFIQQNVEKMKKRVTFVEPTIEEGKAKVAEPEAVLKVAIGILGGKGPLAGAAFD